MADQDKGSSSDSERRAGRGWLSSIDTLPEECEDDIAWANAELRERKMPQTEILKRFNARIADKGQAPISRSAFSRYSVRAALELRKLDASRQITDAILSRIAPGERSESMIAATELVKYRVLEMVMSDEELDPKLLNQATLSLQRLSSTAAREAEVQRRDRKDQREEEQRTAETEARIRAEEEAAEAATKIATEAGLDANRIRDLRRGVLGLAV